MHDSDDKMTRKKNSPVILEEIDSVIKTVGACRNKPIDIYKNGPLL